MEELTKIIDFAKLSTTALTNGVRLSTQNLLTFEPSVTKTAINDSTITLQIPDETILYTFIDDIDNQIDEYLDTITLAKDKMYTFVKEALEIAIFAVETAFTMYRWDITNLAIYEITDTAKIYKFVDKVFQQNMEEPVILAVQDNIVTLSNYNPW